MAQDAIFIRGLSFAYPGEKKVLEGISFNVKKGDCVGIIGQSGCGKSTLLHCISGIIPNLISGTMKGEIRLMGVSTQKAKMPELARIVQTVFQCPDSQIFALNVEDEIVFGPENLNLSKEEIAQRLENALYELRIADLRLSSLEELSSGQKQRVALASVLAMKPAILLFDEPTANLDKKSTELLVQTIKSLQKKHTIVIVEHNTGFVRQTCNKLLLMDNGKIVDRRETAQMLAKGATKRIMGIKKLVKRKHRAGGKKVLEIKDLSFNYPNGVNALSHVNLSVSVGEFLGIIGENGSGKSTLALNIIGLLSGRGSILLDGKDITHLAIPDRCKQIGYVFQTPDYQLFEENLADEISFGPKNIGLDATEISKKTSELLKIMSLEKQRDSDPHSLSVGQKRRLSIAAVLAMGPKVIIIDEPDTGLDSASAQKLMAYLEKLNKAGCTIIMISHNQELIDAYCTRTVEMKAGRVIKR